ncbi:hypothetical protein CLHUN_04890 [Ruminiclostridium hungatei]|uniref:Uncharacterized protein n=1 Tax=Ruminiclostridium hungatei TaxID=48256 RepID=A0A1V4SQ91_RUMHU|nr:hypothetical protein [Ruminiclostridium hungatei]OPX46014.1 hypothetical protein CLHUN_04890 [Ruminiclostridium hungatei]
MEYFWTNTVWYALLGLITIFELIIIFRKTKNVKFTLAFYLTVTGLTLAAEITLFFVFSAYDYYPKIIPSSYYDDELTGNLFSQFSASATALLVPIFNLSSYWIFIFAVAYGLIEELFLALGVYSHNWYRTWMTPLGMSALFWLVKKIYSVSIKKSSKLLHYLNIYFSLITLVVITICWGFILTGRQNFSRSLGKNPISSPYLVSDLYTTPIFISLMIMYFRKWKIYAKAIVITLFYIITYILGCLHIIYFYNIWWYLFFTTSLIFGAYFSIVLMDYLYKSEN